MKKKSPVSSLLIWSGVLAVAVFTTSVGGLLADEPYEANWQSLQQYECPDWFRDAKFGIYAHWGVYSAARGSGNTDWYSRNMYTNGHPSHIEHEATYGPVSEFGYKDLVPLFKAENFNADAWVDLYIEAGAKFAGPVGEHSDGFAMWDSEVNPWNAVDKGPRRDVVGEMETAVRKRGLKFLVSMHHQWLWGWYPTWDKTADTSDSRYASLYGPSYPPTARGKDRAGGGFENMYASPLPSPEFQTIWLQKVKEVVSRYSPDLLWFDNRMELLSERTRAEMASYYYNHALSKAQRPVLTYKRPDLPLGTATSDLERARMPDIYPEPWLTDSSIARSSWGWATDLEYYSTDRLVDDLVDVVSKNGCLLLNIAPHPDGSIPEEQQKRLRGIGKWLRLNGDAIYGSRPWLAFGEGPTTTPVGHLSDLTFDGFGSKDIRFTTRGSDLYAIALGWPESGTLTIKAFSRAKYSTEISDVRLLGHDGQLEWKRTLQGLEIILPSQRPCDHAYVFQVVRVVN